MDKCGYYIDLLATMDIPTLSRNVLGETPTSFFKETTEIELILKTKCDGNLFYAFIR